MQYGPSSGHEEWLEWSRLLAAHRVLMSRDLLDISHATEFPNRLRHAKELADAALTSANIANENLPPDLQWLPLSALLTLAELTALRGQPSEVADALQRYSDALQQLRNVRADQIAIEYQRTSLILRYLEAHSPSPVSAEFGRFLDRLSKHGFDTAGSSDFLTEPVVSWLTATWDTKAVVQHIDGQLKTDRRWANLYASMVLPMILASTQDRSYSGLSPARAAALIAQVDLVSATLLIASHPIVYAPEQRPEFLSSALPAFTALVAAYRTSGQRSGRISSQTATLLGRWVDVAFGRMQFEDWPSLSRAWWNAAGAMTLSVEDTRVLAILAIELGSPEKLAFVLSPNKVRTAPYSWVVVDLAFWTYAMRRGMGQPLMDYVTPMLQERSSPSAVALRRTLTIAAGALLQTKPGPVMVDEWMLNPFGSDACPHRVLFHPFEGAGLGSVPVVGETDQCRNLREQYRQSWRTAVSDALDVRSAQCRLLRETTSARSMDPTTYQMLKWELFESSVETVIALPPAVLSYFPPPPGSSPQTVAAWAAQLIDRNLEWQKTAKAWLSTVDQFLSVPAMRLKRFEDRILALKQASLALESSSRVLADGKRAFHEAQCGW